MERLDKISKKFNRPSEQVEYDLMSILKWKNNEREKPDFYGIPYYHKLVELLENMGCIELEFLDKVITDEGKRLIRQGFVIQDFKTPKKIEQNQIRRDRLSLLIGFLGVIVAIATVFFQRPDTLRQTDSEFGKFNRMVIQDTINLPTQIDEITQESDSTSKKDSIKNK